MAGSDEIQRYSGNNGSLEAMMEALEKHRPHLSRAQYERAASVIMKSIAKATREGHSPGYTIFDDSGRPVHSRYFDIAAIIHEVGDDEGTG